MRVLPKCDTYQHLYCLCCFLACTGCVCVCVFLAASVCDTDLQQEAYHLKATVLKLK